MLVGSATIDGTPYSKLGPGSRKKVKLRCDGCRKITITQFNNYTQAQRLRNLNGRTECRNCGKKAGGRVRAGRKNPGTAKRNKQQRGDKHPSWKGGTYVNKHGYRMVNVNVRVAETNGARIGWTHYRPEHILVMEASLGRKLTPAELVHHIDGDKLLNELLNLWLTSSAGHRKAHLSLQELGYQLIRAGLISFDRDAGTYYLSAQLQGLIK